MIRTWRIWRPDPLDLEPLEEALTGVVAAIRQQSNRRTRIVINGLVGKLGGLGAVSGITAFITTFGTASTGAAIGGLSGAAATTAQLYWIGSIVGLGVAGGSVILTGTGLGVAVLTGFLVRRRLFGRSRKDEELAEAEKVIVVACLELIPTIRKQLTSGIRPSPNDMRIIAEHVLLPLARQIDRNWSASVLQQEKAPPCRSFEKLPWLQRRKLARCRTRIDRIARAALRT